MKRITNIITTKYKKTIFCFVFFVITVLTLHLAYYLSLTPFQVGTEIVNSTSEDLDLEFVGYDYEDKYIPNNEDPQVIINGFSSDVESMMIKFEDYDIPRMSIEVFYSMDGIFTPFQSTILNLNDNGELYIPIVYSDVESIRIDVNDVFNISSIEVSEEKLEYITDKEYELGFSTLLFIFISFAITYVVFFTGCVKFISNHFSKFISEIFSRKFLFKFIPVFVSILFALFIEVVIYIFVFDNIFNIYRLIFVEGILLIGLILFFNRNSFKENIAWIFLKISLIIGTILILIIPPGPMISWDDETHFRNAVVLSDLYEGRMTMADYMVVNRYFSLHYNYSDVQNQNDLLDVNFESGAINQTDATFDPFKMLGYLPNAIGLFVGKLMQLPYHITFMLGKVFNLLFYSIMSFIAINKLKSGKLILALIALFPTSLYLAVNYTYDATIIASLYVSFAYIISLFQEKDKKVTKAETVIIISSFIFGCLAKAIYFPMILIALLLPKNKFKDDKHRKIFNVLIIGTSLLLLLSFILPFFINTDAPNDIRGGMDVNTFDQVSFILNNPIQYTFILLNFLKGYLSFSNAADYITFFAYIGRFIGFVLYLIILFLALFFDRNKVDTEYFRTKNRILIGVLAFGTVCLVATSLYISFTPVGLDVINGVQARYLLPIVFPIYFLVGTDKLKYSANYDTFYLILISIASFISLYGIYELIIKSV